MKNYKNQGVDENPYQSPREPDSRDQPEVVAINWRVYWTVLLGMLLTILFLAVIWRTFA